MTAAEIADDELLRLASREFIGIILFITEKDRIQVRNLASTHLVKPLLSSLCLWYLGVAVRYRDIFILYSLS